MTKEEIAESVSMRDVLAKYGLAPNRAGFIRCPFHNERTASMKIYPKDFHCFGCGAHGDVFDFVERYENLSFRDAFLALGGTYEDRRGEKAADRMHRIRDQKAEAKRRVRERQQAIKEARRKATQADQRVGDLFQVLQQAEPFSDEYCQAAREYEYAEYLADIAHEELRALGG